MWLLAPEMEREIHPGVRAGPRAHRKGLAGKALGRPRRVFRRDRAIDLRSKGVSWRKIAKTLDLLISAVIDA